MTLGINKVNEIKYFRISRMDIPIKTFDIKFAFANPVHIECFHLPLNTF